jgi:predicted DNA-binding transcriptional regulator AlpA
MEHSERRSLSRGSDVRARCGNLSNQQLLRLEAKGLFPRRVRIGPTIVGYYTDEIDNWIATRVREGGRPVARGPLRKAQAEAAADEEGRP